MAGNLVRCRGCAEILDAALRTCPRCGTRLRATSVVLDEGSFADRYHEPPAAGPDPPASPAAAVPGAGARRPSPRQLVAAGSVLLVAVAAFTVVFDPFGSPAPPPEIVIPAITPAPTPTLPATIARTLAQLNDPDLNATLVVDSSLTLDAGFNNGRTRTVSAHLEATVSAGNESGTLTTGSTRTEFRVVGSSSFSRVGNGQWKAQSLPASLQLLPLFGLTEPAMLGLVGNESRDGWAVVHLRSTSLWPADPARLALLDLSTIPLRPERTVLDLWVEPNGLPFAATMTATVDTSDGSRHLLLIQTTYTFRDVGLPVPIGTP